MTKSPHGAMIAHFKKYGPGYLYALGIYVFVILLIEHDNPATEMLVFAIKLPFLILYIIVVEGIPSMIIRTANLVRDTLEGLLWLAYIGAGVSVVLWVVRRLVRIYRH